jgi:hypothetical protein
MLIQSGFFEMYGGTQVAHEICDMNLFPEAKVQLTFIEELPLASKGLQCLGLVPNSAPKKSLTLFNTSSRNGELRDEP